MSCSHAGVESGSLEAGVASERTAGGVFAGTIAALFAVSAAVTIVWCGAMQGGMLMPGGWTMSMAWMRMPGVTWPGAAASFVGMWVVMMAAMMLPSLTPMLVRYRGAVIPAGPTRMGWLTAIVGLGYFCVWAAIGAAIFPLGGALAAVEMKQLVLARAVPVAVGVVILIAGAVQFTPWKAHHLARCREEPRRDCKLSADSGTAWRQGLHFGLHCSLSCANLTLILLVIGVMDLRAMALVSVAITAERLGESVKCIAPAIGVGVVTAGLILIARAAVFG